MVSYLAPGFPGELFQALADHLARSLGRDVDLVLDVSRSGPTVSDAAIFDEGGVDLAFVCSTSYVWLTDTPSPRVALAGAAWVPNDPRAGGRAVMLADVVTRPDGVTSLEALRGRRVAYNDESSLSGWYGLRIALRRAGITEAEIEWVRSGSHARSVALVREGAVAAAAIDVPILRRLQRSDRLERLRTIATVGPYPSQPAVVRHGLGAGLLARLRIALLRSSADPHVAKALRDAELLGFTATGDYDFRELRRELAAFGTAAAPG
jgi:ABC-type phosphate/phosphonate transport system substrate-binding protein